MIQNSLMVKINRDKISLHEDFLKSFYLCKYRQADKTFSGFKNLQDFNQSCGKSFQISKIINMIK